MNTHINHKTLGLVADVGATNVRLALVEGDSRRLQQEQIFECKSYNSLKAVIDDYYSALTQKPTVAAVAMPNPILGDQVKMTNHTWQFSIECLRRQLHLEKLRVLNDFTALAMAVPYLQPQDYLQVGGNAGRVNYAIGVIGPGTGLGVSGLVWGADGGWHPLMSEGGHTSYTPLTEREWAMSQVLNQKFGHVSFERVVSGMGLVSVYQALCELDGVPADNLTAPDVCQRALDYSCARCAETLDIFCAGLGTVAGNLALTLGAKGGMYIGGGIVPHILGYLKQSEFRKRFESKGRFTDYLTEIPTYIITNETPTLIGAMIALEQQLLH